MSTNKEGNKEKICDCKFHCRCMRLGCYSTHYADCLKKYQESNPPTKEGSGWDEKITDHIFDGSCCYNNNENGKGHEECRYPYNHGRENPSGKQCLKLKEQHFDIKSLVSKAVAGEREKIIEKLKKWTIEENGITHKESFRALLGFLSSLNKEDNG